MEMWPGGGHSSCFLTRCLRGELYQIVEIDGYSDWMTFDGRQINHGLGTRMGAEDGTQALCSAETGYFRG